MCNCEVSCTRRTTECNCGASCSGFGHSHVDCNKEICSEPLDMVSWEVTCVCNWYFQFQYGSIRVGVALGHTVYQGILDKKVLPGAEDDQEATCLASGNNFWWTWLKDQIKGFRHSPELVSLLKYPESSRTTVTVHMNLNHYNRISLILWT